jgi:predicted RNA-binding protein with TRAM domain
LTETKHSAQVEGTVLSTFHGLKEGDEAELEIMQKSRDGRGLARLNGLLVFVDGASPGDKVTARIVKIGARHAEAEVVKGHKMATANATA